MGPTPGQDPSQKPGHERGAGCLPWTATQPGHYQLVMERLWSLGQKVKNLSQALPHEPSISSLAWRIVSVETATCASHPSASWTLPQPMGCPMAVFSNPGSAPMCYFCPWHIPLHLFLHLHTLTKCSRLLVYLSGEARVSSEPPRAGSSSVGTTYSMAKFPWGNLSSLESSEPRIPAESPALFWKNLSQDDAEPASGRSVGYRAHGRGLSSHLRS